MPLTTAVSLAGPVTATGVAPVNCKSPLSSTLTGSAPPKVWPAWPGSRPWPAGMFSVPAAWAAGSVVGPSAASGSPVSWSKVVTKLANRSVPVSASQFAGAVLRVLSRVKSASPGWPASTRSS